MQAYSVPCWWVGWWLWRAGCISQHTYLLYIFHILKEFSLTPILLIRNVRLSHIFDLDLSAQSSLWSLILTLILILDPTQSSLVPPSPGIEDRLQALEVLLLTVQYFFGL